MTNDTDRVFVLSSGSYSDYRVHCVVRGTEQEAKELAARANASGDRYSDDYVVEEMAVVAPDVQRVEILTLAVEIFDDGRQKERDPQYRVEWPFDALYGSPALRWRWVRAPMYHNKGGRLEVWGTDHERVRKVYSDRRAAIATDDALRARRESEGAR